MFFSSSISLRRSVADASSSSCGIERPRRPRAPLRNGAGEPSAMAAANDDIVWSVTGNDDLIAVGLAPEDDDDTGEDAVALFGIDVGSGSAAPAPINLDGNSGEGATATGNPLGSNSNSSTPSVAGNSNVGKRKSPVWTDFDEIYETEW